jgi:hypothetical protein
MAAKKTGPPTLSEHALTLKRKLAADKDKVETIKANISALAEGYESALEDMESVIREASAVPATTPSSDDQFLEAVQGSKGTGLQKSRRLITLRQLRKRRGGSLRQMTDELSIPFPHVSQIERGMRLMTPAEQKAFEEWAGGRVYYRMVPYVDISDEDVE